MKLDDFNEKVINCDMKGTIDIYYLAHLVNKKLEVSPKNEILNDLKLLEKIYIGFLNLESEQLSINDKIKNLYDILDTNPNKFINNILLTYQKDIDSLDETDVSVLKEAIEEKYLNQLLDNEELILNSINGLKLIQKNNIFNTPLIIDLTELLTGMGTMSNLGLKSINLINMYGDIDFNCDIDFLFSQLQFKLGYKNELDINNIYDVYILTCQLVHDIYNYEEQLNVDISDNSKLESYTENTEECIHDYLCAIVENYTTLEILKYQVNLEYYSKNLDSLQDELNEELANVVTVIKPHKFDSLSLVFNEDIKEYTYYQSDIIDYIEELSRYVNEDEIIDKLYANTTLFHSEQLYELYENYGLTTKKEVIDYFTKVYYSDYVIFDVDNTNAQHNTNLENMMEGLAQSYFIDNFILETNNIDKVYNKIKQLDINSFPVRDTLVKELIVYENEYEMGYIQDNRKLNKLKIIAKEHLNKQKQALGIDDTKHVVNSMELEY